MGDQGIFRRLLMSEAAEIFWELEGKHKRSADTLRLHLNRIKEILGAFYLDEMTEGDVEEYRYKRINSGHSPSTANREQTYITRIFNAFRRWRSKGSYGGQDFSDIVLPDDNPGALVRRPAEPPRMVIVTSAQFNKWMKHAHPEIRKIAVVALLTRLRRKDLRLLSKTNVNFVGQFIRLVQSKTGHPVLVPLDKPVRRICEQSRGDRILNFKNFRRRWGLACKRSGIDFQLRDLRRTGATFLLESGASAREVQDLLGHRSLRMTENYLQLTGRRLFKYTSRVAKKFNLDY